MVTKSILPEHVRANFTLEKLSALAGVWVVSIDSSSPSSSAATL